MRKCPVEVISLISGSEGKDIKDTVLNVRDWSLITGRGGYKTGGGGGHVKFYPYEKGGAEKVLSMLKGGHKKFWGSFYAVA